MKLDASISAIVTGGASGLGAATARRLAARGVRVAIFDVDAVQAQAVASEIAGVACAVDVTKEDQVEAAFVRARTRHGQERIFINCAGTGVSIKTAQRDKATGEISHHPLSRFEQIIQINLIGSFRCLARAAAGMMQLGPLEDGERGVVVNTASIAAMEGQSGQVAYSASKAGIVGMTLPIARDLMGEGIRVNTIMPGVFETPLMRAVPAHLLQALAQTVAFPKRLGQPEEFAALVETVVTNTYLNGESIRLDGGIRMGAR